ncbi:MAG: nuclear transport factor 2 family protein [Myxococcota bacterium]
MRARTPLVIASIYGGLALGACSKNPAPPEPATAQVSQRDPVPPVDPATPAAPEPERKAPAAERRGPADRTAGIEGTLALMEAGDFGKAFTLLADPVTWTEVGLPKGELDSLGAVIDYQRSSRTGLSDFHLKPKRIIESADYQVVELVWSARHTGAFADGTPATDKTVTLPAAMLLHYQRDGLVDRVWVFQDWPNALQQLGLAPGLPEGFHPAAMPDKVEVVTGPEAPDLRARYLEQLARPEPQPVRTELGRAGQSADFQRKSTDVSIALGAGGTFVAFATNELVYRGGFLAVAPADQEVTTHTLDIVELDPATGRFTGVTSYGNSYEIMAALQITAGAAERPDGKEKPFGVPVCDAYIAHVRACGESVDAHAQQAMLDDLDRAIATWAADNGGGARAERLTQACTAARAAAKAAFGASCPSVDWAAER